MKLSLEIDFEIQVENLGKLNQDNSLTGNLESHLGFG